VLIEAGAGAARFQLVEREEHGPPAADLVVATDAANRLLILWGRRSSPRRVTIETDGLGFPAVEPLLWPGATAWPPASPDPDVHRPFAGVTGDLA
jgi:hypothetical protein